MDSIPEASPTLPMIELYKANGFLFKLFHDGFLNLLTMTATANILTCKRKHHSFFHLSPRQYPKLFFLKYLYCGHLFFSFFSCSESFSSSFIKVKCFLRKFPPHPAFSVYSIWMRLTHFKLEMLGYGPGLATQHISWPWLGSTWDLI